MKAHSLAPFLPFLGSALVAAGLAGCYDPNLGDNPFQCGDDEPVCPLGYDCVSQVCIKHELTVDSGVGGPDAGGMTPDPSNCPDKDLEQNDSQTTATQTGLGHMVGLAVCGVAADKDYYKIFLKSGDAIKATVKYKLIGTGGKLDLTFFGGAATETMPDKSIEVPEGRTLTATARPTSPKTEDWFYLKVIAQPSTMGGGNNFYDLDIVKQK